MTLSRPAADRELRHRRNIHCEGYRRSDGLWDIEGRLTDAKSYPFHDHHRRPIAPGVPFHDLHVRLTVDLDLLIHAVETVSDTVPNPICREVNERFRDLEGLRIAPGFSREVKARLGGRRGCTHLVELIGALATAAFQSVYQEREATLADRSERERPHIVDTCHTLRSDGPEILRRWPQFYTGAAPLKESDGTPD